MLRQRLITAAVLIPLAIAGVWFLPDPVFAALVAIFVLVAAWEWASLMGSSRVGSSAFMLSLMALMFATWMGEGDDGMVLAVMGVAVAWWIGCLFWIRNYPHPPVRHPRVRIVLRGVSGCLVLVPAFLAFTALHGRGSTGPAWVLFLLLLVWAADTGAYFTGRIAGRRNLLPKVSPGKTYAGVAGGLVLGLVLAAVLGIAGFGLRGGGLAGFLVLCAGVIVISIVGDLTISVMKRLAGCKDSGRLFPGHGGVLDRLDSLLAAGPCFLLGLISLGLR